MKDYLEKIDPYLVGLVKTCKQKNDISCIVYASNYEKAKNYLKKSIMNDNLYFYDYPFMNAFGVKASLDDIYFLAKSSNVTYITASTKVFAQINIAKKVTHIDTLNEKGFYGRGVTIAIIDTGIKPHFDFVYPKNRILIFKDFLNSKEKPYDDNGHGTFVAGIACGSGIISNKKYAGVAPKANIIALKTLNEHGEAGAFSILEAMQWVYDNNEKYNIKVVCMSFGSNPMNGRDPLSIGAEALWKKGITVVAAAGNSGPDASSIKSPGISSRIITVGALDDKRGEKGTFLKKNFKVADFSSRGPAFRFVKPDLLAPGVNLTSTSQAKKEFYTHLSGTSVATPIVAGLCALMIEKYPQITPDEIKGLLIQNATPINYNKNEEGYGLIDANKLFDY